MNKSLAGLIALSLLAAGCAAPEAGSDDNAARGEYRTGSNIPRKTQDGTSRVEVVKPEDLDRTRAGPVGMPTSR